MNEKPAGARPKHAQAIEQRMEFTLAREWLALCGAALEVTLPDDGGTNFSIIVPNR